MRADMKEVVSMDSKRDGNGREGGEDSGTHRPSYSAACDS